MVQSSDALDKAFKEALAFVNDPKNGDGNSSNQTKLDFYALFKQATEGECKGAQPSRLKVVARAKYDAWKKLGKMSKDDAKKTYIKLVEKNSPKFSPRL